MAMTIYHQIVFLLLFVTGAKQVLEDFKRQVGDDFFFRRRFKRKFQTKQSGQSWNIFPIKYVISGSLLGTDAESLIHEAIEEWEKHTCIKFEQVFDAEGGEDFIRFYRGSGCFSHLGRIGGHQGISIGIGCERIGVVIHEIGHALGLWHEQARYYRDDYITINFFNILKGHVSNFIKVGSDKVQTFGVPYDLGSVMHYGPTAFTNDWTKNTITTNYPGYQRTIGQRDILSFYDAKIINKAYCDKKCRWNLKCEHGGYTHPILCYKCACPDGFGGVYCENNEPPKNAKCGGVIKLNGKKVIIHSPGYPSPGFELDQKCSWLIKAPAGKLVFLEFIEQFHFYCPTTCKDYVEVRNSTDLAVTGMRFCCDQKPSKRVYAQGNEMMVIFRSKISEDVGFKARLNYYPEEEY